MTTKTPALGTLSLLFLAGLAGCQARLSAGNLWGSKSPSNTAAGPGSTEGSTPKESKGFAKECGKYSAEQKATARAAFAKAPPDYCKDIEQLGNYDDAYSHGISGSIEIASKQLGWYPADVERIKTVPTKYGALMCAQRDDNDGRAGMMERRWVDAKEAMAKFDVVLDAYAKKAPTQLSLNLAKAVSLMEGYKAKGTARDKDDRSLLGDSSSDVRFTMRSAELNLLTIKTVKGGQSPDYLKAKSDYETTEKKIVQINEEIADAIIEKTEPPKDVYAGADKASLKASVRAHWLKDYPTDKVLGVYLPGKDWERKTGAQWIEASNSVVSYDNSWLSVAIVTKLDDKVGEIWLLDMRKDHIDGGKLKLDYVFKDSRAKIGKVLVKKVK